MTDSRYFEDPSHASAYAQFRPRTPKKLGETIIRFLTEKYFGPMNVCLDVGCGSGQSTWLFSPYFKSVIGTDISPAQIEEARKFKQPNIKFETSPAEKLLAQTGSVQLVTSNQACHWFNLSTFFSEVDRVLCPGGVVALSGYVPYFTHPTKADQLSKAHHTFEKEGLAGYWGKGRDHLDNEYGDIAIPYPDSVRIELWTDEFKTSLERFIGEQTTSSAYQTYCRKNGQEAGQALLDELKASIQGILGDSSSHPEGIQLPMKLKYFLIMGRKK